MSQSPLCGCAMETVIHRTEEIPYACERLEQHGPVRVLMVGGKWAPGVPEEIQRKYAAPKPAAPKLRASRTIGRIERPPKYKQRDHLIPRILESRHSGASWDRIARELRICASSVRRLYGRGVAERSKA